MSKGARSPRCQDVAAFEIRCVIHEPPVEQFESLRNSRQILSRAGGRGTKRIYEPRPVGYGRRAPLDGTLARILSYGRHVATETQV